MLKPSAVAGTLDCVELVCMVPWACASISLLKQELENMLRVSLSLRHFIKLVATQTGVLDGANENTCGSNARKLVKAFVRKTSRM